MSDLGDTTNLEKTSLEAHVDLCAMRYRQLDLRLNNLEGKMDAIQRDLIDSQKSLKATIINSAGGIIISLVGVITAILMKL